MALATHRATRSLPVLLGPWFSKPFRQIALWNISYELLRPVTKPTGRNCLLSAVETADATDNDPSVAFGTDSQ